MPYCKLFDKVDNCLARKLSGSFVIEKFEQETIHYDTKLGCCLENVTMILRIQCFIERVFDPNITIPAGILPWVWQRRFRRIFDKGRGKEMVAMDAEIIVSNEIPVLP